MTNKIGELPFEAVQSGAKASPSALEMISDSMVSAISLPFDLYASWKLEEDARLLSKVGQHTSTAEQKRLQKQLKDDRTYIEYLKATELEAAHLLKDGLKTATLFLRGKTGFVGAIASYSLDEWRPAKPINEQLCDLGLGAAKGAGLKTVFAKAGDINARIGLIPERLNLPLRATFLGASTRTIDTALTRANWQNNSGNFDAKKGCLSVASSVANPIALCTDIATFGFSSGLQKTVNKTMNGALDSSPLLSTVVVGAGFGFSGGSLQEALRQHSQQEKFDIAKIAGQGLLHGAVDSIAAVPGGMQANKEALAIYNRMNAGAAQTKLPDLRLLPENKHSQADGRTLDAEPDSGLNNKAKAKTEAELLSIPHPAEPPISEKTANLGPATRKRGPWGPEDRNNEELHSAGAFDVFFPKGMNCELRVPHDYNRSLDQVRARRPESRKKLSGDWSSGTLALPEDLAALLLEVPNNSIVKRANVYEHLADGKTNILASAKDQSMNFYRQKYDATLRETLNHEWSHILHNVRPELLERYSNAVKIEDALNKEGWENKNARKYATENERENWAVHLGEELLALDASRMLKMCQYAPVRLAVLGEALHSALNEGSQAEVSKFRAQYQARADFIKEHVTPLALKSIVAEIAGGKRNSYQDHLELFGRWSEKSSDVNLLKKIAGSHDIDLISECGLKLLKGNKRAQFDFLYKLAYTPNTGKGMNGSVRDMALRTPRNEASKAVVNHMTKEMIDSYLMPEIDQLRRTGKSPELLADQLFDLSRCLLKHDKSAVQNGKVASLLAEAQELYGSSERFIDRDKQHYMLLGCRAAQIELAALKGDIDSAVRKIIQLRMDYRERKHNVETLIKLKEWTADLYRQAGNTAMYEHLRKEVERDLKRPAYEVI